MDPTVRARADMQKLLAHGLPSYQVPIGDSKYTMPGYAYLGNSFSCIEDPLYPFDLDVVAALRESLEPDIMPVVSRSVWQHCDYGNVRPPFTIMRHALARAVIDPKIHVHDLFCEMPPEPRPGLLIPGRDLEGSRPNFLELEWYDRDVRTWGQDLPGGYLPFDWELFHACERSHALTQDVGGWAATFARLAKVYLARREQRKRSRSDNLRYVHKQLLDYHKVVPTDRELLQAGYVHGQS